MKKIITSLFFIFLTIHGVFAVENREKLTITAEKVEIFREKNEIIFTSKVVAKRNNFTLYTDKMIVNYTESKGNKINITNIKAEKNVKFTTEKITATGDNGFYNVAQNLITLNNNVKATESGITVFAKKFEYNTITGKTNIIGNKTEKEKVVIILDDVENLKNKKE